jgi:hypothetical protein
VKLIYSVGAFAAKPNITGGISVGSVSSPAGWQNKSGTTVSIQIDADNFWNFISGILRAGDATKYIKHDPTADDTESDPTIALMNGAYGLKLFGNEALFNGILKVEFGNTVIELNPIDAIASFVNASIKSYQSYYTERRMMQIDSSSLKFFNSPTGEDDELVAKISRYGPDGGILLGGGFYTKTNESFSAERSSGISYYPTERSPYGFYWLENDGYRYIGCYKQNGTSPSYTYTLEYCYSVNDGESYNTFIEIGTSSEVYQNVSMLDYESPDMVYWEAIRIAYLDDDGNIAEKIYPMSGAGTVIPGTGRQPCYVKRISLNKLYLFKITTSGALKYNVFDTTWGAEQSITLTYSIKYNIAKPYKVFELANGKCGIVYINTSDDVVYEEWDGTSVDNTAIITSSYSPYYLSLTEDLNEDLYVYFSVGNIVYISIRSVNTNTWATPKEFTTTLSVHMVALRSYNGDILVNYLNRVTTSGLYNYIVDRRYQRYAKLGGGIIQKDEDDLGPVYTLYDGERFRVDRTKILAGAIRNTGSGWAFISDSEHVPINFKSVSADSTRIKVDYAFTSNYVGSLIATTDETLASMGIYVGSSVGLALSYIYMYKRKEVHGYIVYSGAVWGISENSYGITDATFSNGKLTVSHTTMGYYAVAANANIRDSGGTAPDVVVSVGTVGDGYTELWLRTRAGALITTPNTDMRIYFERPGAVELIDPSTFSSASGNIWIYGVMQ